MATSFETTGESVETLRERLRAQIEQTARQRMADRLQILAESARDFAAATQDHDRLLNVIARRLTTSVADYCVILMASPDGRELLVGALHAAAPGAEGRMRQIFVEPMLLAEHPLPRHVHETGEPLLAATIDLEQLRSTTTPIHFEFARDVGMHSLLIVALRANERSIGQLVLVRYRAQSPAFDGDDLVLANALADHASLALENARSLDAERAAQDRYRIMFDTNPQPMFVFDAVTLRFLEANHRAVQHFGVPHRELLAMSLVDIWPAEDVAKNQAEASVVRAAGYFTTSRHRRRDGVIADVELQIHSLQLDDRASRLVLVTDVTERLRIERARVAAETRYARLRDSGIVGISVARMDAQGHPRVVEMNGALLDLLGYSLEDLAARGLSWADLTPPEWAEGDQRALEQLATRGSSDLREKQFLHKDGTRVPVLTGSATLDAAGSEIVAFVLDLRSGRHLDAAVERLREALASEATFRRFLEGAPDAVVVINRSRVITLVNSQTERMFGYSRTELVGMWVDEILVDSVMGARPRELCGRRKDGSKFPVDVTSSPLETKDGLVTYASIRDLTDRTKSDEQRFWLAALVESSADAIVGKTIEGTVTSWNEAAHRMFGYSAAEMIGHSISALVPADNKDEEASILAHLARGERVDSFDTVRQRKDGTLLDVSITVSPVRDAAGALIGASKVARDITKRREFEAELARARDTAEASNRELAAFSYSVAHDLRAPLRAVSGFAQLVAETYTEVLDAEGADWLQEVVNGARRMEALIDAMLSLARLTRSELRPELVDVSAIVRAVGRDLVASEPDRSVELVVESGVTAELDPVLAHAMFVNLIGNAWKFTRNAAQARIEFGLTDRDGSPTLFVRDNGAGFDMAYAAKLFGPFQRLHPASEYPGTGIGLATVQRIAHRHGGSVSAEGSVGAGASFYVTLPDRNLGGTP